MLHHLVDEAFNIGLRGGIAGDEDRRVARIHFFKHPPSLVLIAGHERHLCALGQKGLGDPPANARRAAGDRRHPAFKLHTPNLLGSLGEPEFQFQRTQHDARLVQEAVAGRVFQMVDAVEQPVPSDGLLKP